MDNSEGLPDAPPQPGQLLRAAREQAGISAREMADRLNWMPSIVTAVEDDRFETLRGPAFVRGYLRAYARIVGVDEERVLAAYAVLEPEQDTEHESATSSGSQASSQTTGMSVAIGIGMAALLVMGVWWYQYDSADQPGQPSAPVPREQSLQSNTAPAAAKPGTAVAVTPDPVLPKQAPVATEPQQTVAAASQELAVAADESRPSGQPGTSADDTFDVAPIAVSTEEESGAAESGVAIDSESPAAELASLRLQFSGDCWLEVRDADGQLIYADLRQAGDQLSLDGRPPFSILAGDATALQVFYEDEEFAIPTRPGRNSSQFTVGEL